MQLNVVENAEIEKQITEKKKQKKLAKLENKKQGLLRKRYTFCSASDEETEF